jgi:hypothetical protein
MAQKDETIQSLKERLLSIKLESAKKREGALAKSVAWQDEHVGE